MNILILGSGGREHTLAWKIQQSPSCTALFVAPGNAGTEALATNLDLDPTNAEAVAQAVRKHQVSMLIVGPEAPLVAGVHDYLADREEFSDLMIIGPRQAAAALEGSKEFAKAFMQRHNIPTASYQSFDKGSLEAGKAFLRTLQPPYVLKADGLAAGKGVVILDELEAADQELEAMLQGAKFGEASAKVVIEEFLDGIELSCFVLTNGKEFKVLPMAKDYKRIGAGDTGLNTGGMGAVSPVPFADEAFRKKIMDRIVVPTIQGLQKDGLPYQGFIFIGLIRVGEDPYVIEYNVRMGDPETEVVIPRVQNDLVQLLQATAEGRLDGVDLQIDPRAATTVMAVSGGYPGGYEKGKPIHGLEATQEALLFHAGTRKAGSATVTNGGRVIAVTAFGKDIPDALKGSYRGIQSISFEGMYYRDDIGFDL